MLSSSLSDAIGFRSASFTEQIHLIMLFSVLSSLFRSSVVSAQVSLPYRSLVQVSCDAHCNTSIGNDWQMASEL